MKVGYVWIFEEKQMDALAGIPQVYLRYSSGIPQVFLRYSFQEYLDNEGIPVK